jgi:hypothetical protein
MSKILGYKNEWDVFKNTYLPVGLQEEIIKEQRYKEAQLMFDEMIKNIPSDNLQQILPKINKD